MSQVFLLGRPKSESLTREIETLFRCHPTRWLTLAVVLEMVRYGATKERVNSALHKLVYDRGLLELKPELMCNADHGLRLINLYRWKGTP